MLWIYTGRHGLKVIEALLCYINSDLALYRNDLTTHGTLPLKDCCQQQGWTNIGTPRQSTDGFKMNSVNLF